MRNTATTLAVHDSVDERYGSWASSKAHVREAVRSIRLMTSDANELDD